MVKPPFVRRASELRYLLQMLRAASQGRGQAMMVGGLVGIGKTRLVAE